MNNNEVLNYIYTHNYFSQDLSIALDYYDELKELEGIAYDSSITIEDYIDYVKNTRKNLTFDF